MNTRLLILVLFACFFSLTSFCQDNHYWTDQFGIKATALGGAATSGLDDHSMVYYNAAAMTMIESPSLSFSMNAYQYRTFHQKNALGPGQNLKSTDFATLPNMMAGVLALKKQPKLRLGYIVLSKNQFNNKLDLFRAGRYDVLSLAGDEDYVSSYAFELHNNEYWGGLAAAYQVNTYVSFGLTAMAVYKSTKYYNAYSFTVIPSDTSSSEVTRLSSTQSFNYSHIKAIIKPSFLISYPKLRLGVVANLPSISIRGRGSFYREFSTINVDDVLPIDFTVISRTSSSKVSHKTAGSLALGLSLKISEKCWLHANAEYYLQQKYYLIHKDPTISQHYPEIITDSLIYQLFGNQGFLSYGEGYNSVCNVGIGIDFALSENARVQIGAHTDFNNAAVSSYLFDRQVIESSKYDRLVTSIGGNYLLKSGKQVSAAFEFGFALPKTTDYSVDFTTPNELRNGLTGDSASGVKTSAYSFKLMFGFTLGKR